MMDFTLDDIDWKILTLLQPSARITNVEMARQLEMAPSAVLERVKKLEQKMIIKGYATRIDPMAVNQRLLAFIFIKASDGLGSSATGEAIAGIEEVQEV